MGVEVNFIEFKTPPYQGFRGHLKHFLPECKMPTVVCNSFKKYTHMYFGKRNNSLT